MNDLLCGIMDPFPQPPRLLNPFQADPCRIPPISSQFLVEDSSFLKPLVLRALLLSYDLGEVPFYCVSNAAFFHPVEATGFVGVGSQIFLLPSSQAPPLSSPISYPSETRIGFLLH